MSKHRYDEEDADGERCKFCGFPKPETVEPFQIVYPEDLDSLTRVVRCLNCDEIIGLPTPLPRPEDIR